MTLKRRSRYGLLYTSSAPTRGFTDATSRLLAYKEWYCPRSFSIGPAKRLKHAARKSFMTEARRLRVGLLVAIGLGYHKNVVNFSGV
jgi:hypothetical protein